MLRCRMIATFVTAIVLVTWVAHGDAMGMVISDTGVIAIAMGTWAASALSVSRRASSRVSSLAADRRPGSFLKTG
jgi:hypothetical protein